jgi:SAM-dependent methyltransferase
MAGVLEDLGATYGAWWIDFLGEHNHIGGEEATRWLLERSRLSTGDLMLDCGAFVGAAARLAVDEAGVRAVALDMNRDFLVAGRALEDGQGIEWVEGITQRLPFRDGAFASVWALDTAIATREMSRVTAPGGTVCLCCEVPEDSRGGMDAFADEWAEFGFRLAAHQQMTNEATIAWRRAEAEMVRKRPYYEERYGPRGYLAQLDLVAAMLHSYERGEQGHGLFVFSR